MFVCAIFRFAGVTRSQPNREMERSLEALNQLDLPESDTKKPQSSRLDVSHKEALVRLIQYFTHSLILALTRTQLGHPSAVRRSERKPGRK